MNPRTLLASSPLLCSFASACVFACVAVSSSSFAADTTFIVPSDRVDQAFQDGAANYDSYALERPEYLAYRQAFIYLYQRNPNLPKERAIQLLETWRARFIANYRPGDPSPPGMPGSGPARYDYFNGACDIIGSAPGGDEIGLGFIVSIMRQAKEFGDYRYHRQLEPIYRISSLLKQGFTIEAEREWNRRAYASADAMPNPNLAGVLQHLDQDAAKRAAQIITDHPEWGQTSAIQALQSLMNERGEIVASIEQLKAIFGTEMANLQDTMNGNLTLLQNLAANQDVLYRYMVDAERQRLNQERIGREQAAYEQKVQAANASVYILSTLVGFNNPELGHQMQVVGDSTVQIANALHQFAKADALGSVILTGNMLGAVMNVVSLFGDSGPSPDQQILEQIALLQQMVQQLRVEMHERFDRVDAALNEIYSTMNERFNRIDIVLGILRGDVEEIQQTLYNLESDLYRIERKVFNFLDAGFRRDLNETINGYLGYRETYGVPIPWTSYVFAENKFHTWAVNNALDEISSGSAGRGYDDASLFAELNSQPLENNLNYLSQYLANKGWPAYTTVRLANPRDWAIAANSWMELAGESPMFFRQVSSNRLEQIYRVGEDIQRAVNNITLITTNMTPEANRSLFDSLFWNYKLKGPRFKLSVTESETAFRVGLFADSTKTEPLRNLDLWGGPFQSNNWQPPILTASPLSTTGYHGVITNIAVPSNWISLVPASSILSDLLDTARLSLKWSDYEFTNRSSLSIGNRTYALGTFQLTLNTYTATNKVFAKCLKDRDWCTPSTTVDWQGVLNMIPDHTDNITSGWLVPGGTLRIGDSTGLNPFNWADMLDILWNGRTVTKSAGVIGGWWRVTVTVRASTLGSAAFVRSATEIETSATSASQAKVNSNVQTELRELQRGSYTAILNGLSEAGNLQSAASEVSGAKALIDSFIVLGFSRSLEFNDVLGSLLFGDERLVETEKSKELCQLGIARTYDTNQNAKVDIATLLDERVTGLETWVSNRLTQVETNGAEPLRLVSSTLSRLDAFRAGWSQPTPPPYIAPLGLRLTNGVPNRLFIVWGEPNLSYVIQTSTNLATWTDLPTPADEGTDYITTPTTRSAFYRAVLRR